MRERSVNVQPLLGGKYRLEEFLGSGGMGSVHGARHQATGRRVAIKRIHPALLSQPDWARRVSREARLAVEAAHPNVVEVLDAGSDENGVPYLVLERLYGDPLDAWMGQPLSLRATAQVLVPVVNALVHLHGAGIVHRDLKPSNIFLDVGSDGRMTPKLLDFGLAKALENDTATRSGVALGTPAYMAPEQALGGAIGPTTDVWSIAVVFVQCLTGQLPFATRSSTSLRTGIRPQDLAGVPEALSDLLARSLSFEPSSRPADMQRFRAELSAALAQADREFAWPSAATVAYAADELESELARPSSGLAARGDGSDVESAAVHARPRHLVTRTLAPANDATAHGRRRLALVALPLATVGLFVFAWAGAREPPAVEDVEPPPPAPAVTRATSSAVASPPSALWSAPSARTASSATPSKPRPVVSAGASSAKAALHEPDATPPPVVGANRSPIIE